MCLLLKKKKLLLSLSCWSESFPKVFSVLTFCSKDTRALTFDSMCLLLKLHYTFCSKDIFCSKDTRALTFDSLCLLLKLLLLLNCWSERLSRQKSKRISFIGFSSPSGSCNIYIYIYTHTYVCMYVHTCCVLTNPPIRMYIHTCCVLTNLYIYIYKQNRMKNRWAKVEENVVLRVFFAVWFLRVFYLLSVWFLFFWVPSASCASKGSRKSRVSIFPLSSS